MGLLMVLSAIGVLKQAAATGGGASIRNFFLSHFSLSLLVFEVIGVVAATSVTLGFGFVAIFVACIGPMEFLGYLDRDFGNRAFGLPAVRNG
jgi:hypothetical protein